MIGLFFDTETTGIKRWDNPGFIPRLVQLGAILQDIETKRVLAELNVMVHPEGIDIPVEASNVHGISKELATEFGMPMDMVDSVFENMLDKADFVVAHNIEFDRDIVKDNLPQSTWLLEKKQRFCTMQGSLYLVKSEFSEKQKALFAHKPHLKEAPYKVPNLMDTHLHFFDKTFEGAHDAMADIRACRDVFLELLEQGYWQVINGEVVPTDKLDAIIIESK